MRSAHSCVCIAILFCVTAVAQGGGADVLWYDEPAGRWTEALPLGNGRLGAMVFGATGKERIQLNEETLWAGVCTDPIPADVVGTWRQVQRLILDRKIIEARKLGLEKLTISPTSFRSYEPLGDLWIESEEAGAVSGYRRQLDLSQGVATIEYKAGGTTFRREVFISAVDDVIVVRLSRVSGPGSVNVHISLTRAKDAVVAATEDGLRMDGQIVDVEAPAVRDDNPGGSGPGGEHMKFAARVRISSVGGDVEARDSAVEVRGADSALILMTAATDFNMDGLTFDRSIDAGRRAEAILDAAGGMSFEKLHSRHVAEHGSVFDRVRLDLGGYQKRATPTDERLAAVRAGGDDPDLTALYFQFGRYLLMSSSRRPGRVPANLQGIWNDKMWAPWEADYHLNINLQMNYWPADLCNLSETVEPLTDWFEEVTGKGRTSARRLYDADGWVAFTTVNLFGRTTPGGSTKGSQFQNGVCDPLAGAWMAMTLWRHYEFTADRQYLRRRAYPVLKGACEFVLDYLVEDHDGHLVAAPSTSPENSYIDPQTKQALRLTRGSTYHNEIIRALFSAVVEASRILDVDGEFAEKLTAAAERLPALKIGVDGTIQEWIEDYGEREPGHRHMSHLMGLHPFGRITREDGRLFEAAAATIERRLKHGGGHTGWSRAWVVNFYARLRNAEQAHYHILMLLRKSTHPNLFDNHPPFQIDGNFGGTAGIAEMLLQSHAGYIELLAAVPEAWRDGQVCGLKARGGFVVDMQWSEGRLSRARIAATVGGDVKLSYAGRAAEFSTEPGEAVTVNGRLEVVDR